MQDFWQWAGSFWWLIFPIMGMAGGAAKAWERSAKRRHERRMETLRLKGELKTAQLAARGGVVPKQSARQAAADDRASSKHMLEKLFAEHDEITARWLDYELDVAKLIAFPAMSDGRQPLTAAFLRAKKIADTLRPASSDARVSETEIAEYLDAVGNYAVAFEVAERDARRLRNSTFTPDERRRLDRAQHMLTVALDEAATQAERNIAYKRVREELDGLILLSDEAVDVLEKKVAGALPQKHYEPATSSAPPASAAPASAPASAPATAPAASAPATPTPEPEPLRLRREDDRS